MIARNLNDCSPAILESGLVGGQVFFEAGRSQALYEGIARSLEAAWISAVPFGSDALPRESERWI